MARRRKGKKGPKVLVDQHEPKPPFYLAAEDLLVEKGTPELFIKHIYCANEKVPGRGAVVMAPGMATNANIFRMDDEGGLLSLEHDRSFANLLASQGFSVYLYHPSYTERVHNRYVCAHFPESVHYCGTYRAPANLTFDTMVNDEVLRVVHYVTEVRGEKDISWVGYSLGGMLMYAYLAIHPDRRVKNVVTIGTPITLNQLFIRVVPFINWMVRELGFEESDVVGGVSSRFVPMSKAIGLIPGKVLRYNPISLLLANPFNLDDRVVKMLLTKVVETVPGPLAGSFSKMIVRGLDCKTYSPNMVRDMDETKKEKTNFLFIFGQYDLMAPPDTVLLAHEIITPHVTDNVIGVPKSGHVDIVVGKNAREKVWLPVTEWLKEKNSAETRPRARKTAANEPVA
ncbi:MAG: alpha/beta fold hydrolase [Deltaproteobacteria bacterium]|nr:alpha/beta fold hydrolase [Deltaproteobacteria bacterium]